MDEFLRATTSFPAVVWTVLVLISVGFWLISTVLGFDGADGDLDLDLDAGDGADGASSGLLDTLDLAHAPLSVVVTIISLLGWLVTMVVVLLLGTDVSVLVGMLVLGVAVVAAVIVSGRVVRLLGPLYDPNRGTSQHDLIGRICTVRSRRVDADFGQATAIDGDGASHTIQVRCPADNELAGGSRALIVDVDDGVFRIDPDLSGIEP